MKTQIRILLGSMLLLTAAMASAQTQRVTVTVPFSFVVGSQSLPAGDYTIELNLEGNVVQVRSGDRFGAVQAAITGTDSELTAATDKSYVSFRHYGGQYFLAAVWSQGASQILTPGKLEQQLARTNSTQQDVSLAAPLSLQ